ncbi:MAG: hypothetical protein E7017_06510 [Alphaproteobacteria bacterium]|nr:hypothetical protein [Alphaproteobacteria bacterium]
MSFNTIAGEIIHGIDIDEVYNSSDWSSRDKIKEYIKDYTVLLDCKKQLKMCDSNSNKDICMDELAIKIIKHFYGFNSDKNIADYKNYIKSVSKAYGVVYCLNKYDNFAGSTCEQEVMYKVILTTKQYIEDMLSEIEQENKDFVFLQDYKP